MTRFGNTAGGMSNRRLCNATNWPFLAIRKSKFAPPSNLKHRFGPVRTRPNGFGKVHDNLNHGPNLAFSSGWSPDFELNFGQVHISSGSNLGSEPDCGSTTMTKSAYPGIGCFIL